MGHERKKKGPAGKYIFAGVVFVLLVAAAVALIMFVSKSGELRLTKSKVAATVNGEEITVDSLEEQYSRVPAAYQAYITRSMLLNQSINEAILLQEAAKQGISVTEADVEAEITTAMEKSGITEEQLDERLKQQNITKEYLTDLYSKQLTINALLEKAVFPKLKVSDAEIKQFYDSRVRAMHILVETEDEANDIIDQLKDSTEETLESDFSDIAKEKSTDPSAKTNGGDLGEFGKGQMVKEFEVAAFALDEGSFTAEPVKTQFGYHVILRLEKNETLSEQSAAIKDYLLTEKKSKAVPLYVEQLRSKAVIAVDYVEPEVSAKSD
jgi:foldase protein PrsA